MVKSLNLKSSSSRMGPHFRSRTSLQVELVGDNDGGQVGDCESEQQHISQHRFCTTLWELFLHLLQSRSPPRPVFDRQCCPFLPYLSHSLVFISDQVSMWKCRLGAYIFSIFILILWAVTLSLPWIVWLLVRYWTSREVPELRLWVNFPFFPRIGKEVR